MPVRYVQRLCAVMVILAASVFACQAEAAGTAPTWAYRGEITNPGTRSEGFRGLLYFQGRIVPGALGRIVTPLGTFSFNPPENASPWSHYGWVKAAREPVTSSATENGAPVSSQEHWYKGAKRPGTPGSWVYLPRHDTWLDPASMEQFARENAGATQGAGNPASLVALAESLAPQGGAESNENVFEFRLMEVSSGTKSAHEEGNLLIGGKAVPGVWLRLKTPIGTFHHMQSELPWQDKGWLPDAEEAVVQDSAEAFTRDIEQAGRYQGKRLVGMPTNWCYSPILDFWLSPAHLVRGY